MFDSLNPYNSLVALTGDSPEALVSLIKEIRTPIKILAITSSGTKQVAYIMGDVRVVENKKKLKIKENKDG